MCGIVLLCGPLADVRLPEFLERLRHRGPDCQHALVEGDIAIGFNRLAVNGGESIGRQPYRHGEFIGAINGEIYNHRELVAANGLETSPCDTNVVLPLLASHGPNAIQQLDGFYSGIALHLATRRVLCLRDHIGKKPLFWGRSGSELFISSEMKAMDECDCFEVVPLGVTSIDLETGTLTELARHRPVESNDNLAHLFESAVRKRLPTSDQPVGVFLSGGLDSSLVAAMVSRVRDDAIYFTLGNTDGPDWRAAQTTIGALGLRDVRTVPLPSRAQLPELIRSVVYATESFNPSIVSNGLATYLLARAGHEAGLKVVLSGEGADELFGGYHNFGGDDPWRQIREQLILDMQVTELRRLDMSCMANSVEARCPFLDRAVRSFSDSLDYRDLYSDTTNKVHLRRCFKGVLPETVLNRRKVSFDVGSGIRGKVVRYLRRNGRSEREVLGSLWREFFAFDSKEAYFHAYPVFDAAIDRRGVGHR